MSERCAPSPLRSVCPALISAETLRPRLAKRCRNVSRSERLLPSVPSVLVLWAALSAELCAVLLAASPVLRVSVFWK